MKLAAEHRLRNELAEIQQVSSWVQALSNQAGLSRAVRMALDHALVEWITNIISYAYDHPAEHWITIRFQSDDGQVRMEVEDDGRPFNPLDRPPVDTTLPLEQRPIGGLGIHMIRQLMDAVEYQRTNGRNTLRLIKRIGEHTGA